MKRFHVKRFLGFFLAVVIMFGIFTALPGTKLQVSASGDWRWVINQNSGTTITITEYTGATLNVSVIEIPGELGGFRVTGIADGVFMGNNTVTNIIIPYGVTNIGNEIFAGCANLTEVITPDTLREIGQGAFSGCTLLEAINLPQGVTGIRDRTFENCTSLTSVITPESAAIIGANAFENCINLENVTIPGYVNSIGANAFNGCTNLENVIISYGVDSIGNSAFFNCVNLTNVSIADSVTSIGENAFNGCAALIRVVIPKSIHSIGDYAFANCSNLAIAYFTHSVAPTSSNNNPLIGNGIGSDIFLNTFRQFKIMCHTNAIGFTGDNNNNIVSWIATGGYFVETIPEIYTTARLELVRDNVTETIEILPRMTDFELYSYVVETNGIIRRVEPLYCNKIDISSIIPNNRYGNGRVKIYIVRADSSPIYAKNNIVYEEDEILSNTITLSSRWSKMNRSDIEIDYINEEILGSGRYDYRMSLGAEWRTITLSNTRTINISNFRTGGILEIRRSATSGYAAGAVLKIKIAPRQKTPSNIAIKRLRNSAEVFTNTNNRMEFSPNGVDGWSNAVSNLPVNDTNYNNDGTIYFRYKATLKAMKSSAFEYAPNTTASTPVVKTMLRSAINLFNRLNPAYYDIGLSEWTPAETASVAAAHVNINTSAAANEIQTAYDNLFNALNDLLAAKANHCVDHVSAPHPANYYTPATWNAWVNALTDLQNDPVRNLSISIPVLTDLQSLKDKIDAYYRSLEDLERLTINSGNPLLLITHQRDGTGGGYIYFVGMPEHTYDNALDYHVQNPGGQIIGRIRNVAGQLQVYADDFNDLIPDTINYYEIHVVDSGNNLVKVYSFQIN